MTEPTPMTDEELNEIRFKAGTGLYPESTARLLAEVDYQRAENDRLRSARAEVDRLRDENGRLRDENADLTRDREAFDDYREHTRAEIRERDAEIHRLRTEIHHLYKLGADDDE